MSVRLYNSLKATYRPISRIRRIETKIKPQQTVSLLLLPAYIQNKKDWNGARKTQEYEQEINLPAYIQNKKDWNWDACKRLLIRLCTYRPISRIRRIETKEQAAEIGQTTTLLPAYIQNKKDWNKISVKNALHAYGTYRPISRIRRIETNVKSCLKIRVLFLTGLYPE